jgi:hypothetical protein
LIDQWRIFDGSENHYRKGRLIDEDFLYAEEAEWCSRIKKYGKLCIFGSVKIVHL